MRWRCASTTSWSGLFLGIGIRLVDFKVEFGRLYENDMMRIVLADEISPDCCRLWDIKTGDKLDKDRFRRDLGGPLEAYQEVARRLGVLAPRPAPSPNRSWPVLAPTGCMSLISIIRASTRL
jgi:phosphoribosylaminoimidazole-succinocarboxamide synthase